MLYEDYAIATSELDICTDRIVEKRVDAYNIVDEDEVVMKIRWDRKNVNTIKVLKILS